MDVKKLVRDGRDGILKENRIWKLIFVFGLLAGSFMRLYQLGSIPDGIHADEAYAAYNAYSLANYGVDSFGYHNPVYFTAWGGGMNVLNSYLMLPLIKLFGVSAWTIRLPQALLSCLCIWIVYLLVKRLWGDIAIASMASFLVAINPWHIQATRNNIESGLLPTFFLLGLFFFVKAMDDDRWLYASAVAYGLCLYSYATIWPVLPFVILAQAVYAIYAGKLKMKSLNLWLSALILGVLALPLLLFMLINTGVLSEISTSFISIPRLVGFRSGDIGLSRFQDNLLKMFKLLDSQQDGLAMNSTEKYGLYYRFSNVFIIIGILVLIKNAFKAKGFKKGKYDPNIFLVIWLLAVLVMGAVLKNPQATRLNIMHFLVIICIALGIRALSDRYLKCFSLVMAGVYLFAFVGFAFFYKNDYNITVQDLYVKDLAYCFEDTESLGREVYVDNSVSYANILLYTKMPVDELLDTVEYSNYPDAYLDVTRVGKYHLTAGFTNDVGLMESGAGWLGDYTYVDVFQYLKESEAGDVTDMACASSQSEENIGVRGRTIMIEERYPGDYAYILDIDRSDELEAKGYEVNRYGSYCVAYKK